MLSIYKTKVGFIFLKQSLFLVFFKFKQNSVTNNSSKMI